MSDISIRIDVELCKGCSYCSYVCPKGIIQLSAETNSRGYHYAMVQDMAKCTGCRFCALICPEISFEIAIVNHAGGWKNHGEDRSIIGQRSAE